MERKGSSVGTSDDQSMDAYIPDEILDHIVSFLPNQFAARSALVSRRMHDLYQASLFLNLNVTYSANFTDVLNSALLRCKHPLLRLRLHLSLPYDCNHNKPTGIPDVVSLLERAGALGLRHLSVWISPMEAWSLILPKILSLGSLESLSLEYVASEYLTPDIPVNFKHIRSLCMILKHRVFYTEFPADFINWTIPRFDALQHLHIRLSSRPGFLHIKSDSVRKLKLDLNACKLRISAPSLEHFEFKAYLHELPMLDWDWAMPMLRKAVIKLERISEENVKGISHMFYAVANVQELRIDITEDRNQSATFHALLLPGVDLPTFFDLKHLELEIRLHGCNFEDLATLLQHCPVLESLKLAYEPLFSKCGGKKGSQLQYSHRQRNNFQLAYVEDLHILEELQLLVQNIDDFSIPRGEENRQLLQNTEYNYVCFEDLHILGRKEKLLRHLIRRQSLKRLKHN